MQTKNSFNVTPEDSATLVKRATESIERIRSSYDSHKWRSETMGKLYYPLWILFMGGFVFSLAAPERSNVAASNIELVHAFRIVAVIGTILNFGMQSAIISATELMDEKLLHMDRFRVDLSNLMVDRGEANLREAERVHRIQFRFFATARVLSVSAEICALAFLILALFGTWNISPLSNPKTDKPSSTVEHQSTPTPKS